MIGIIGFNEHALAVADAALRLDHTVFIVVPTEPVGVHLLHFPMPSLNEVTFGYPDVEPRPISFRIVGGDGARWALRYPRLHMAGYPPIHAERPVALVADATMQVSERVERRVKMFAVNTRRPISEQVPEAYLVGSDAMINTFDRHSICVDDDHIFNWERFFFHRRKGPIVPEGHVHYNASSDTSWAISSNIDGNRITIWEDPPPFEDIEVLDVPVKTTCTCQTKLITHHLGPWATYRPTSITETYDLASKIILGEVVAPFEVTHTGFGD